MQSYCYTDEWLMHTIFCLLHETPLSLKILNSSAVAIILTIRFSHNNDLPFRPQKDIEDLSGEPQWIDC